MHINVSRLHNAYMLRRSRTCTDTVAVLRKLPCASPLLFACTSPRAMQGLPSPWSAPVSSAAPVCQPFFFFPHTAPFLQTPPRKRTVEVCDAKRVARYLPLARLVEAFGRTTATSACAIATKRQARTHPPTNPPHEASPFQPAACLRCPSSLHLRQSFLQLLNMANCARREAHFI